MSHFGRRLDEVEDEPPGTKLVFLALRDTDAQTVTELCEETYCSRSTVAEALDRLRDEGLVERSPHLDNPLEYKYTIAIR